MSIAIFITVVKQTNQAVDGMKIDYPLLICNEYFSTKQEVPSFFGSVYPSRLSDLAQITFGLSSAPQRRRAPYVDR